MSNIPVCFYCKHKVRGRLKCKAFGDQLIPDEILLNKNDHSTPLKFQQNRITFTPHIIFVEAPDDVLNLPQKNI